MNAERTPYSEDLIQTHPALGILRLAALFASDERAPDDETLEMMFEQVAAGTLSGMTPAEAWPELMRGLMAQAPANMLRALQACGALAEILPEVAALFGVPQIADDPPQVDIGLHLLRVLDETARCNAPLLVRFAALVMNVGKADSPPEHLPVHYRHVERGGPRIEALCKRLGVSPACQDMALLALAECERVHRVSEIRAGPVAAMLQRLGAFDQPQRYMQFMTLCACDYRAYPNRETQDYPKVALLDIALKACATLDENKPTAGQSTTEAADTLQESRAAAIAIVFGSERWLGPTT